MIREMLTVSALGAAAVWAATTASAEPGPSYPDDPGRYASDVPGMVYDVQLTGPCTNMERFTFGRGRGGQPGGYDCRRSSRRRDLAPHPPSGHRRLQQREGDVLGAARPEVRHPAARLLPGDRRAHADAQTQKGGRRRKVRGRAQAALRRRAKRCVVPLTRSPLYARPKRRLCD